MLLQFCGGGKESQKGIIVAFGFGAGAYNEVTRLKHPISKYQQPLEITLVPLNQIVNHHRSFLVHDPYYLRLN